MINTAQYGTHLNDRPNEAIEKRRGAQSPLNNPELGGDPVEGDGQPVYVHPGENCVQRLHDIDKINLEVGVFNIQLQPTQEVRTSVFVHQGSLFGVVKYIYSWTVVTPHNVDERSLKTRVSMCQERCCSTPATVERKKEDAHANLQRAQAEIEFRQH